MRFKVESCFVQIVTKHKLKTYYRCIFVYIKHSIHRYTQRQAQKEIYTTFLVCAHTYTHRVGFDSRRYPITVQGWIVTTAEAI